MRQNAAVFASLLIAFACACSVAGAEDLGGPHVAGSIFDVNDFSELVEANVSGAIDNGWLKSAHHADGTAIDEGGTAGDLSHPWPESFPSVGALSHSVDGRPLPWPASERLERVARNEPKGAGHVQSLSFTGGAQENGTTHIRTIGGHPPRGLFIALAMALAMTAFALLEGWCRGRRASGPCASGTYESGC